MTRKILLRSTLLLILFINFAINCLAIGDTTFLDKNWDKCKRKHAVYFRVVSLADQSFYFIVRDYYKNGVLQMEALCTAIDPPQKNGKCTFYEKDGRKSSQGEFLNNEKKGIWIYWDSSGKDSTMIDHSKRDPWANASDRYYQESWLPQNQSSLFIANVNYRYKLNKSALSSGRGIGGEIGLNLGYFYSQKLLFAIFGGASFRDRLWNTSYNSNYLNDFNSNFNGTNLTGNDSVIANSYSKLVNEREWGFHDRTIYYGLMIRLPFTYFPVIKIYKGNLYSTYKTGSSHQPAGLEPNDPNNGNYLEHLYYDISRNINFGMEVFLYSGKTVVQSYDPENHVKVYNRDLRWITNICSVSAYFEMIDSYRSTFDYDDGVHYVSVPFEKVMSRAFLQKYKTDFNFGLRLSFGVF